MKNVLPFLLVISPALLVATKHEIAPKKNLEKQHDTSTQVSAPPGMAVNSGFGGTVQRDRAPHVRTVETSDTSLSCQERCCRCCFVPLGLHCVGFIFWCNKKSCCGRAY